MESLKWYYIQDGFEKGPFSLEEMHTSINLGQIDCLTKVRNNLMGYFIDLESSLLMSAQYFDFSGLTLKKETINRPFILKTIKFDFLSYLLRFAKKPVDSFLKRNESTDLLLDTNQLEERIKFLRYRYTYLIMACLIPLWLHLNFASLIPLVGIYYLAPLYFRLIPTKYILSLEKRIYQIKEEEIRIQRIERSRQVERARQDQIEKDNAKAQEQKIQRDLEDSLNRLLKSFDHVRSNYESTNECYRRNNKADREFVDKYRIDLMALTNSQCLKCHSQENIHLDHAIFPKNMGGSFIMKHNSGFKFVNCIPLCGSCNSSKGQRSYKLFFSIEEQLTILRILKKLTVKLNFC